MGYVEEVKIAARGQWQNILASLGADESYLQLKKDGPCPFCSPGAKKSDRYCFYDAGAGKWKCRKCDGNGVSGDGFNFVSKLRNVDNSEAIKIVGDLLGVHRNEYVKGESKALPDKPIDDSFLLDIWDACENVARNNVAGMYLQNRGLSVPDNHDLGFHPKLAYYEREENSERAQYIGDYPALVMPIRKPSRKVVGLHRIYLSPDGGKADVTQVKKSRMLYEGAKPGSAIHFDKPTEELGIAEGPETTLYVRQVTGLPMWCGIDAHTLKAIEIPSSVKRVWIFGDNDKSGVGQQCTWDLADRLLEQCEEVRVLFPTEAGKDFLDEKRLTKKEARSAKLYQPGDRWDELRPLEDHPVPDFDIENLPACSWEYVLDVHEAIRCPMDYPAASVLMSIAAVVGAGVRMRPYMKSGYSVVPNLFGCVVGGASYRKTPGTSTVFGFLSKLDEEAWNVYERELKIYGAKVRSHKQKVEGFEAGIKQISKDPAKQTDLQRLEERLEELELNPPEKPNCRRFRVNTITIKKLMEVMSENDRGVFVYRDELAGLIQRWEDPKNSDERFFILEAFNGHETHIDDTLARGRVKARACMSLFGGVHPHRMRSLVKQAIRNGSDGLIARFQLMVYPNRCDWEFRDESENVDAKSRFGRVLKVLAETDFVEFGAVAQENGAPYFQFTPEASKAWERWLKNLMKNKLGNRKSEHYSLVDEHLAKYPSFMASLAVLIHLAEMADRKVKGEEKINYCKSVELESAQKAIALCEYFEVHMRRVYSLAEDGLDQITSNLAQALQKKKIQTTDGGFFTARDAFRVGVCDVSQKDELYVSFDKLVNANWIKLLPVKPGPGRPTFRYVVNPRLLDEDDES